MHICPRKDHAIRHCPTNTVACATFPATTRPRTVTFLATISCTVFPYHGHVRGSIIYHPHFSCRGFASATTALKQMLEEEGYMVRMLPSRWRGQGTCTFGNARTLLKEMFAYSMMDTCWRTRQTFHPINPPSKFSSMVTCVELNTLHGKRGVRTLHGRPPHITSPKGLPTWPG